MHLLSRASGVAKDAELFLDKLSEKEHEGIVTAFRQIRMYFLRRETLCRRVGNRRFPAKPGGIPLLLLA